MRVVSSHCGRPSLTHRRTCRRRTLPGSSLSRSLCRAPDTTDLIQVPDPSRPPLPDGLRSRLTPLVEDGPAGSSRVYRREPLRTTPLPSPKSWGSVHWPGRPSAVSSIRPSRDRATRSWYLVCDVPPIPTVSQCRRRQLLDEKWRHTQHKKVRPCKDRPTTSGKDRSSCAKSRRLKYVVVLVAARAEGSRPFYIFPGQ